VLFEQEHYIIDSSGKVTRAHRLLYRIETKAGVDEWSQTSIQWDPWYQNQPSIRARVLQVDGKVSELDTHTLTDVPAKNEQDDAFSNARIYKGPLPSLAIGAITCTPEQTLEILNQLEEPEFILTLVIAATGLSISEALGS
jgi:hypothetical protein